ncbi:MAG: GntR family transcriptional regulator [Lachnospiraceae bacterium]|nr:GntR family transcriptional regulator [Lachnospiraceae bacterium]
MICKQIMNKKEGFFTMSKYETLSERLTEQITQNLQKGITALPTEAALAEQHQVSRQTVRAALSLLRDRGLIESRQGSGSYATGLSPDAWQNNIPILIASSQEYIYPHLLSDIRSALTSQGYQLRVYATGNDTSIERKHLLSLLPDPPRGLIVEGSKSTLPTPNADLFEKLKTAGTRLLFLHNRYDALPDEICIKDDNYYGGYLLASHLADLGHTRIAGLFRLDDRQGPERYLGAVSCLRDLGHELEDRHVGWFQTQDVEALEKKQDTRFLAAYIKERLGDCTAVICYNDEIAYWLIKELSYAHIQVPRDVSVVCFDNSYLSDLSKVRITTLTHRPHEMGSRVADTIIRQLKGIPVISQEIPWELVRKESDAPAPI